MNYPREWKCPVPGCDVVELVVNAQAYKSKRKCRSCKKKHDNEITKKKHRERGYHPNCNTTLTATRF